MEERRKQDQDMARIRRLRAYRRRQDMARLDLLRGRIRRLRACRRRTAVQKAQLRLLEARAKQVRLAMDLRKAPSVPALGDLFPGWRCTCTRVKGRVERGRPVIVRYEFTLEPLSK